MNPVQPSGGGTDNPATYIGGDQFHEVFRQEIKQWVARTPKWRTQDAGDGHPIKNPQWPDPANEFVGLALSGGGIRSATFSLGVCQSLAKHGVLERVDYLSTVSGGGYLGSAISSLLHHQSPEGRRTGRGGRAAPHPLSKDGFLLGGGWPEPGPVRHLRQHSNYLAPRFGPLDSLTWQTVLDVAVRMVMNLALVAMPIVLVLVALTLIPGGVWNRAHPLTTPWAVWPAAGLAGSALLISLILVVFLRSTHSSSLVNAAQTWLIIGVVAGSLWAGFVLAVSLSHQALQYLAMGFGGGLAGVLAVSRWAFTRLGEVERARSGALARIRWIDRVLQVPFKVAGYLVLAAGIVLGFVGLDYLSPRSTYIVLALLALAGVAVVLVEAHRSSQSMLRLMNWVSLHSLYRHRLGQAYIMREAGANAGLGARADFPLAYLQADTPRGADAKLPGMQRLRRRLGEMARRFDASVSLPARNRAPVGPYHVVTTCLNMMGSGDEGTVRGRGLQRKAESFGLSCLYSGSVDTGFVRTEAYPWLTLGAAMSISGAAVSPNMGSYTNPSTSILLTLLNIRLGQWLSNPRLYDPASQSLRSRLAPDRYALWLYYLKELFAAARPQDPFIYLSDGGHFETLGIYELVRRGCRYIIAVDGSGEPAGQDPQFSTLGEVCHLVRVDFGVDIQIDLTPLLAGEGKTRAASGFVVGKIQYPAARAADGTMAEEGLCGLLVYIKAVLTAKDTAPDVEAYHRREPAFPNHLTLDQFFDEAQFEAYRKLGEQIADTAFGWLSSPGVEAGGLNEGGLFDGVRVAASVAAAPPKAR